MYQGLDRLISYFLATAEHGSISSAARALNMTQPALTRNIRALEQILDVQLFERHSVGVQLTPSGQLLARRAKFMQLEFDHAMAELQAFKEGWQSEITIGASPSWSLIYVPEIIPVFRERISDVRINIVSGLPWQLLSGLFEGEVDIIFSGLASADSPELATEPLVEMERVVIASADHPLAGGVERSPEDLLNFPWISRMGDEIAIARLRDYFLNLDLKPPKIDITCNLLGDLLSVLRNTNCLATVPSPVTRHSIAAGIEAIPIRGALWRYRTGLIHRREPRPTEIVQAFLSCARSYFQDRTAGGEVRN